MPAKKKAPAKEPVKDVKTASNGFKARFDGMMKKTGGQVLANRKETYIDFKDPHTGKDLLALQWLLGCRGLPSAVTMHLSGAQASGKSSFLAYLYGMGLLAGGWVQHQETERAELDNNRLHALGCNPDYIGLEYPNGANDFQVQFKKWCNYAREEGSGYPVMCGLDSVSQLTNREVGDDGMKDGKDKPGEHSKFFSEFFRDHVNWMHKVDARFIAVSQVKSKIGTMPGQKTKTCLAEKPFAFGATWQLEFAAMSTGDSDKGIAKKVQIRCEKSKRSGNQGLDIAPKLYRSNDPAGRGWDWSQCTAKLLTGSYSPFPKGTYSSASGYYKYDPICPDGKGHSAEDFVNIILDDEMILNDIRNAWRIQGYGLPFETEWRSQ